MSLLVFVIGLSAGFVVGLSIGVDIGFWRGVRYQKERGDLDG